MSQYPDQVTLEELVNIISGHIQEAESEDEFSEKLKLSLGFVEDLYDLSEDDRKYIMFSFVALEEHSNTKTLLNAAKAMQIVKKKKKK